MDKILVGDIGGTNVRFGLASFRSGKIEVTHFEKLSGKDYASFEDSLVDYLGRIGRYPKEAMFALAGIPQNDAVQLMHRNWHVSAQALRTRFAFARVELANDFAAMARAVPEVSADTFKTIHEGVAEKDSVVLVAGAGTGLGVGTLLPDANKQWRVISGEGGHMAYAPRSELEVEIAWRLKDKLGYVSYEVVCSGEYMCLVHETLCEIVGQKYHETTPQRVLDLAESGDATCLDLCRLRARAILSAAGNATLVSGAWGGVVLVGGVTQHLSKYLCEEAALACFFERGPRTPQMQNILVRLMMAEEAPLIGAAALYFGHVNR